MIQRYLDSHHIRERAGAGAGAPLQLRLDIPGGHASCGFTQALNAMCKHGRIERRHDLESFDKTIRALLGQSSPSAPRMLCYVRRGIKRGASALSSAGVQSLRRSLRASRVTRSPRLLPETSNETSNRNRACSLYKLSSRHKPSYSRRRGGVRERAANRPTNIGRARRRGGVGRARRSSRAPDALSVVQPRGRGERARRDVTIDRTCMLLFKLCSCISFEPTS